MAKPLYKSFKNHNKNTIHFAEIQKRFQRNYYLNKMFEMFNLRCYKTVSSYFHSIIFRNTSCKNEANSRIDQEKFAEHNLVVADHVTSNFLEATFHKFYWTHFRILCLKCS